MSGGAGTMWLEVAADFSRKKARKRRKNRGFPVFPAVLFGCREGIVVALADFASFPLISFRGRNWCG